MAQLEEHKKNGFTLAYDIQFSLTVLEETLNYFKNKKPQELSTAYSLPYKKLIRLIDEKGTKSVQSAHIQNIYIGYNNMIGTYNGVIKNEVLMTQ